MNEEVLIKSYMELTGSSEAAARSVLMFVSHEDDEADRNGTLEDIQLTNRSPVSNVPIQINKAPAPRHFQPRSVNSKFGPAFDNGGAAMTSAGP